MDTTRKPPDHPDAMKSMGDMAHTTAVPQRLYTVEEFDRMLDSGILGPDERLELMDGIVIEREPMNAAHASIVARLTKRLQQALRDRALLWPQLPIVASPRSKPFPDVALVLPRDDFYTARLPIPEEVFAIVEVSDSMLDYDRGEKLPMYARAGIPEYWVIDVKAKSVEVYRDRHDLGYGARAVFLKGRGVAFAVFPDILFAVEELVG